MQARIAKEYAGMSQDQAHKIQDERVAKDPILGPFLKKVCQQEMQRRRTTA